MQRILVMGPSGCGKSTLARHIGKRLGLPVFHLDQAYWRAGWIKTPKANFRTEVERTAALPAWVIDGNYTDTIEPRFRNADTLIYLDIPTWLLMPRIILRTLFYYGRVRPDAALGCPERLDLAFLRFAWSWNRTQRTRVLAQANSFAGRKAILRTRAEQRRFLADHC